MSAPTSPPLPLDVVSPHGDGAESLRRLADQLRLDAIAFAEALAPLVEKARVAMAVVLDAPLPPLPRLDAPCVILKGRSVGMTSYERAMAVYRAAFGIDAPPTLAEIPAMTPYRQYSDLPVPLTRPMTRAEIAKQRAIGAMTIPGPSRVSMLGKNGKREKTQLPANPNRRMRAALRAGAGLL